MDRLIDGWIDRWIDKIDKIDSYAHTMVANQGLESQKALMSLYITHQLGTWLLKWVPPELNNTGVYKSGFSGYTGISLMRTFSASDSFSFLDGVKTVTSAAFLGKHNFRSG